MKRGGPCLVAGAAAAFSAGGHRARLRFPQPTCGTRSVPHERRERRRALGDGTPVALVTSRAVRMEEVIMFAFTRRLRIGLAGVIVAALPGLAAAQPLTAPPAHKGRLFEKCDVDGNGRLDRGEKKEMRRLRKARLLKKFDVNGDGKLDRAERAQAIAVRIDKMVVRFDTDGSGTVSYAEASVRPHSVLARKFQVIDANGNGVVTKRELTTAKVIKLNGRRGKGKGRRLGGPPPV
jgi:Ca2+-binding EF-hand superfamily protein